MPEDLQGRTFLVTGANSGLGRATAEALAARGGTVVLAARSEERTRPVLDGIRAQHRSAAVEFLHLDVSDLAAVRRAAEAFLATGRRLDVLVNNAGVAGTRALSADGFDLTYATNHIGPFLLTSLLLPAIERAPQGRVVNVSSVAHKQVKGVDWTMLERRTEPRQAGFLDYGITKLMNILHAKELARRLTGTRVTTYAVHPGRREDQHLAGAAGAGPVGPQAVPAVQRRGGEDAAALRHRPRARRRHRPILRQVQRGHAQPARGRPRFGAGALDPDRARDRLRLITRPHSGSPSRTGSVNATDVPPPGSLVMSSLPPAR